MAGQGPAPKPANRRVRKGSDPIPQTRLEFRRAAQPALPEVAPDGEPWPQQTRDWWAMWAESAQADIMTAGDWSFLLDTAPLHARLWQGEVTVAAELRLRVAKFGQTIEDRARLRITFADADEKDAKRPTAPASRSQFGDLRLIDGGKTAEATG